MEKPLKIGIGGPVGSGKTALIEHLCKTMRQNYQLAAITNDIYTREDAEILLRVGALPADRILGVETGLGQLDKYTETRSCIVHFCSASPPNAMRHVQKQ